MRLKDYISLNDKEYYISTTNTFDVGLETMVFESKNQSVVNWKDLYYRHYNTIDEAIKGHKDIVDNLEAVLNEGNQETWDEKFGFNPNSLKEFLSFMSNKLEKEGK